MSFYLAPSLVDLRSETNTRWPDRDKASDGWVGDTSHQARVSDHNPDYADGGIVRAIDVDKDGISVTDFLNAVIYDNRTSYCIYNYRIWGGTRWRKYEGANAHTKHVHVSIKHTSAAAKSGSWGLVKGEVKPVGKPETAKVKKVKDQSPSNTPNGSTTFPTDYAELKINGNYKSWEQGAIQILMHQLGYKSNKQWDGKIRKLGYTDLQNWLRDVRDPNGKPYYIKTPVAKWGVPKGTPLKVDGKPGQWFWYEFQRYLKDRKFYKGILDGEPKKMTYEAIQRWLNDNNDD
ncbi:hypothetical protein [Glutamicibacter sp. AOP5-A2-18]|uniref:hypothetical protein n=1 Tax=Glutamicibacter sp. AOP5-A2-18 TaxID=3457656 RepID=UPI0040338CF7